MPKATRFYWKGKPVSEKVYKQRLAQQQSGRDSAQKRLAPKQAPKKCNATETEANIVINEPPKPAEGRRIVELLLLGQQMWCTSCKECLSFANIEEEQRRGLGSILSIRCHKCLLVNIIHTSKKHASLQNSQRTNRFDVNTKLVIGMINSGIGYTNVNKLLSCLNIPEIDFKTYKKYEEEVGRTTEDLAKQSCEDATELEKKLTLDNLSTLRDNLPEGINASFNNVTTFDKVVQIVASYDMGWSTRGTGRNYDSLNGYGAIVGLYSQSILDYSTCNRKCKKCDNGRSPFDHDCRVNFSASAKAMEAHTANKLVNDSSILKSKNVEVGIFIGDNDSSAIASCRANASHNISKLSDINHTSKGVSKQLYAMEKNYQELNKDGIKYLHRCFTYAMAQNKGNSKNMAATIRSIPYHTFNNHDKCGQWCGYIQDKGNYDHRTVPGGFTDPQLFEDLKLIFDNLADNAEKFSVGNVSSASSNVNESLNASMVSKAPKSKCLSLSASADYRYASVVCQKNVGDDYTTSVASKLNLSPAKHHTRYVSRIVKTKMKRAQLIKTQAFKKNRIILKKKKNALRYKKETLEGTTYESNSTLLEEAATMDSQNWSDEEGTLQEKNPIMFFDLETTGLQSDCDIVQIALKCGNMSFNVYINPKQDICTSASAVHGLRKFGGDLMLHNNKVDSVSLRIAMGQLLSFLQSTNKKCYFAAHNLKFDGPRLYRSISICNLQDDFLEVLEGFIDTLPIIRKNTNRTGKNSCTITGLANWLNISCINAHDATKDVAILEKIVKKLSISYNDLILNSISYKEATEKWLDDTNMKKSLQLLNPLNKILGVAVRKKLIKQKITIDVLKNVYFNSGADGIHELLKKSHSNKKLLTQATRIKIINWLEGARPKED